MNDETPADDPIVFMAPPPWVVPITETTGPLDMDRDEAVRRLRVVCAWGRDMAEKVERLVAESHAEAGIEHPTLEDIEATPDQVGVQEGDGPVQAYEITPEHRERMTRRENDLEWRAKRIAQMAEQAQLTDAPKTHAIVICIGTEDFGPTEQLPEDDGALAKGIALVGIYTSLNHDVFAGCLRHLVSQLDNRRLAPTPTEEAPH